MAPMLYDLNIAWSLTTTAAALDTTLRQAAVLGYSVVALNHTISKLPIPSPIANPIPILPVPAPAARTSPTTVLRRATVLIADPRDNHRLDAIAAAFDILAVRPTTEAAFNHACVSLADPALVTFDLTANMGFHFRPKPVMAAVRRGLRFEVCYAQALAARADNRARALFVANLVGLLRASKGRGIVVSSGAAVGEPGLLRAPADVANLLTVWGMGPERALYALGTTPRGVVVNEGMRRSSFRGVIAVVQGAGPATEAATAGDGSVVGGGGARGQAQQKQRGVKRKNGEQAVAGDDSEQKLSKRQSKKQKQRQAQAKAQAGHQTGDAGGKS